MNEKYAEALRRIEEARITGNTELDLSKLELTELPREIASLTHLIELDAYSNQLTDISGLSQLTELHSLYLSNNQLTDISVLSNLTKIEKLWLSNNQLTDISVLANLTKLNLLWLENIQLTDITPLSKLNQLKKLSLRENLLTDLNALSNLMLLEVLQLSNNKIIDIMPLANLKQLKGCYLSDNQVTNILPLSNLNQLIELWLSSNQLTDTNIAPLSYFTQLSVLLLNNNQLKNTIYLEHLTQLTVLGLANNQLRDITHLQNMKQLTHLVLDNNQLTNIGVLSHLTQLTTLYFSNNQLTDATPLANLTQLTTLYFPNNQLTDATPLANLTQLKYLWLSENQLTDATPLANLTQLTTLWLSNNQLTDISALSQLAKLRQLKLSNNYLYDLTPIRYLIQKIDIEWQKLQEKDYQLNICITNNPLICPPREIVENGKECIEEYFAAIDQSGKRAIGEARVLIVGEGQSGKTTLLKKLIDENYVVPKTVVAQTEGIQIQKDWKIKSTPYKAHLWDFGGQEIQYKTHQLFLSGRCVYVLLTNARQEVHHNFRYWLHAIQLFGQNPDGSYNPVLVLNNAHGNGAIQQLPLDDWRKKFPELPIKGFDVNLAAPNPTPFKQFRAALGDTIQQLPHLKAELPVQWLSIKKALERERRKRNHLTELQFYQICAKSGLTAESNWNVFSDYLHDLGQILRFRHDIQLRDFVVLNPEWAVNAMYSILTQRKIQEVNKGRFTEADVFDGWQQYTFSERTHLLRLMGKDAFDICYPLSEGVYIAPQLLDNQPPTYPKKVSSESVLKFRLTYDFMPKGILSRFSVREHAAIARNADQQQVIWSKGVLLAIQDCYVEVLERDYDIEGSIEIAVHGDGFQAKKVLFQVVESLKVVNKRWWHQVKQEVPCCCKRCLHSDKPHFFQLSYLDERLKVGKAQVECMITPFEAVEIKAVLAGVMETEEVQARLRSNPSFAKRFRMEDFKKLMSKNKLEDAIQLFDSDGFIDNDEKNMIIHFKRQLHSLKKEAQLGKLSHSEFAREESKIADACLGWANDLEGE